LKGLDLEMERMTQVTADEELEETVTRLMDILFQHSNWDLGILGNAI